MSCLTLIPSLFILFFVLFTIIHVYFFSLDEKAFFYYFVILCSNYQTFFVSQTNFTSVCVKLVFIIIIIFFLIYKAALQSYTLCEVPVCSTLLPLYKYFEVNLKICISSFFCHFFTLASLHISSVWPCGRLLKCYGNAVYVCLVFFVIYDLCGCTGKPFTWVQIKKITISVLDLANSSEHFVFYLKVLSCFDQKFSSFKTMQLRK